MRTKWAMCLVLLLAACQDSSAPESRGAPVAEAEEGFKLLMYTRTTGFRHGSIPMGVQVVQTLGAENGIEVTATEDPALFTDENLAQYAVVLFLNTTGDILDEAQRGALQRFLNAGGGFAGVHSAADTEYSWPYYDTIIGARFHSHPPQQVGIFDNEAPDHPANAHLPARWTLLDEFYSFTSNPRPQVRVLLSIDEGTYLQDPNTTNLPTSPTFPQGETGVMGDHPMSWCHDNVGGRVWYTALGHSAYLYLLPAYREHLLNGILTAARRVPADCSPPAG